MQFLHKAENRFGNSPKVMFRFEISLWNPRWTCENLLFTDQDFRRTRSLEFQLYVIIWTGIFFAVNHDLWPAADIRIIDILVFHAICHVLCAFVFPIDVNAHAFGYRLNFHGHGGHRLQEWRCSCTRDMPSVLNRASWRQKRSFGAKRKKK